MIQNDDRTPPSRVRVTGLQEAQLAEVLQIDAACAAMYHEIGFDAAEVPVRLGSDFAALTRSHSIHVAEADHVPAGLLIWRDEAPGVAYLADISVHPDYQRFGIASKLLDVLREEARRLRLTHIIVRAWAKAPWAMAFYRARGFAQIDAAAPTRVIAWRDERLASGRPLARPGEIVLWAEVGAAPKEPEEDEDDASDIAEG